MGARRRQGLTIDDEQVTAVATPGHTSNHLCFAWRGALLSGDHVMGWSTTVVVPPDGDMADYMASLDKLRKREDRIYYPAHGPPVTSHSNMSGTWSVTGCSARSRFSADRRSAAGPSRTSSPTLIRARSTAGPGCGGSVLAHLLDLERRGSLNSEGDAWTTPLTQPPARRADHQRRALILGGLLIAVLVLAGVLF